MTTCLYYYTGTGNSLWVARKLAQRLDGDVKMISLGTEYEIPDGSCDRVGIIFPVHIWGLPSRVMEFVTKLPDRSSGYMFALAVNAGQVAGTLLQLQKMLVGKGNGLGAGFDIKMPSNYIIWNGAQPEAEQAVLFDLAENKLDEIAGVVKRKEVCPPEKGPWWQNLFFSLAYKLTFSKVPSLDKDFWVEPACNGCGLCARICSAGDIIIEGGRPVWQHRCEQCLACLQWCPQEAIQYGKKTTGKKRYHHPEVSAAEMIATAAKRRC